ncbi:hypothetical protein LEP1GSC111_2105 [Leptospira interrogans str. UT126]|nr:hypothetical protein LEP1GSC087_2966 [Leptospira interrogans serovar Bataviae str. L1111]EMJ50169.1 hypothetical protein LEP1GSC111_2105 [Leptospira interrogans str. UT126]EMN82193.1 hypothetical protein LEP1GSC106_0539 [Leptospira interrogans serovar Grippotyphosa str. UI 12764]
MANDTRQKFGLPGVFARKSRGGSRESIKEIEYNKRRNKC